MAIEFTKEALERQDRPSLSQFSKSIWAGFLSRIQRAISSNINENDFNDVAKFYEKNRYVEGEEDILDAAAGWYSDFAFRELVGSGYQGRLDAHVWDLGCGQSTLLKWLQVRNVFPKQYLGLDAFISSRQRGLENENVKFIEADMRGLKIPLEEGVERVLVAVNSLCYVERIEEISALHTSTKQDRKFERMLVTEPFPSMFWEVHFSDINIYLRSPNNMVEQIVRLGWNPERVRVMYLMKVLGLHLVPLAYSMEFSN